MSMNDDSRVVFVGDRRQAIYGFTGASNDAMDRIREEFDCIELPLSINYRCAKRIVEYAKSYCPQIEADPTKEDGFVERLGTWSLSQFEDGDAILCRVNAPLIMLAYRLIGKGIAARVMGRDIGQGLITLAKKLQGKRTAMTVDDLLVRMEEYRVRETSKWRAKGNESKVQMVVDKVESLEAAIDGMGDDNRTVAALIQRLETLFSDRTNGGVTLASCHKSKGLQFKRVFVMDPGRIPSPWARREWQHEQEMNLMYVAVTRAVQSLFFVDYDDILTDEQPTISVTSMTDVA